MTDTQHAPQSDPDGDLGHRAIDGLRPRFRQHLLRLARIPSQSSAHPGYLRAAGKFWQSLRRHAGMSLIETAERVGRVTSRDLSLFEAGLLDPEDLPADFIDRLAAALGRHDAVALHIAKFGSASGREQS